MTAQKQAVPHTNPFIYPGPVTGEHFCNRKREMEKLLQHVGTKPPQSVNVYGPFRIGKTSFLRHIAEHEGPARLGEGYRFLYFDLQGYGDPDMLLLDILQHLDDNAVLQDPVRRRDLYMQLRDIIETSDRIIVMCWDELGKALEKPAFDADFFDFFRSVGQSGRLALVVATPRRLAEMAVPSGVDLSRFFNIFIPLPLSGFPEDEARRLATGQCYQTSQRPELPQEIVEQILERSRLDDGTYHPLIIQIYASHVYEALRQRETDLERAWENAEEEIETILAPPRRPSTDRGVTLQVEQPASDTSYRWAATASKAFILLTGFAFLLTIGVDPRFMALVIILGFLALVFGAIWLLGPE